MSIYFITGNKNKFEEARKIVPDLEQLDIDLAEIQSNDPVDVIKAKLKEAFNHCKGEFVVEDTSLCLNCLGGLPGPLTKWFLKIIGNEGLFKIASALGNFSAEAKTGIGYAKSSEDIHFFTGVIKGKIVSPRGNNGFGWDPIFEVENLGKTFAELTIEEKNEISMRRKALQEFKIFLEKAI